MNIDSFINKYNWKPVDFDGFYGYQCMDLMHQYIKEQFGLPGTVLQAPTAYQAWLHRGNWSSAFTAINNLPWNTPQEGDIVFWNTRIGPAGHVGIYKDGNVFRFNSFDQNWPAGTYCHKQSHSYYGVAGWLHKK